MRSEEEIQENLNWLKGQCVNFRDDEQERISRQLETLLWVLDHEREVARTMAESIWQDSRLDRRSNPRNYGT